METQCHNCKHRDDPNRISHCTRCKRCDDDSYHGKVVHLNWRELVAQSQQPANYVTSLPKDIEDKLREAMTSLFGLDPIEMLLLSHIMHGGKLSTFADTLRKIAVRISRYRGSERAMAHAMKEAIGKKWPSIAPIICAKGRDDEDIDADEVEQAIDEPPLGDLFENAGCPLG